MVLATTHSWSGKILPTWGAGGVSSSTEDSRLVGLPVIKSMTFSAFRGILRISWFAITALLPISGRTPCMTLRRQLVTVRVWIVTKKRGCAQPTQDMVAGQDGLSGALAAGHVEGE